jgi:hypothetical protein
MFIGFLSFSQEKKKIDVYFEFDKYEITPKGKITLDSIVDLANNSRAYNIRINAYTDSKGTNQYNFRLANKRKKSIFDYFIQNHLDFKRVTYFQINEDYENLTDDLRRKAIIEFEYIKQKKFYGKNGTQVSAGENDNVTINEYFSAKEMIRDSKFAIDDNEQIIRSDGMITICYGKATLDETGNFYLVEMPSRQEQVNTSMNVYTEITNDKGEKRWKQTEIKIDFDKTKNRYIFKIPIESNGCVSINLDCRVLQDDEKIVYIATQNLYDNVEVRDAKNKLLFSAFNDNGRRINQYIFLTKKSVMTKNMVFYGYNDKKKTTLHLRDFGLEEVEKKERNPAKEYYTELVNYSDSAKDDGKLKIEKKGFLPWIKRIFTGKRTYITINNKQQTT